MIFSMLVRFGIILNTELNLFQILLEDENFDEALNLLDQACSEVLDLDVQLYNILLQKASERVIPSHLSPF
jgi:hypothetical protein